MSNLYSHIDARLHKDAERVVIESGARITGSQLATRVAQYTNALLSLNVLPGDRVAAQVEKSVENIVLYLSCLRAGAVYLPLNSAYRAAEIEYFLSDAAPKVFVAAPEREKELKPVAEKASVATLLTLSTNGDGCLPTLAASQSHDAPIVDRRHDDLAVICYTSGTTGRSKGAMITHRNLLSNAEALVRLWGFTNRDVLLHALP